MIFVSNASCSSPRTSHLINGLNGTLLSESKLHICFMKKGTLVVKTREF